MSIACYPFSQMPSRCVGEFKNRCLVSPSARHLLGIFASDIIVSTSRFWFGLFPYKRPTPKGDLRSGIRCGQWVQNLGNGQVVDPALNPDVLVHVPRHSPHCLKQCSVSEVTLSKRDEGLGSAYSSETHAIGRPEGLAAQETDRD